MEIFWRLISYVKPYKWEYTGVLILGIFSSMLQPGAALSIKPILEILMAKQKETPFLLPVLMIVFTLFCAISRYYYEIWAGYLSEKIIRKIRMELYQKYTSLSLDYYSESSTAKLMTVVGSDVVLLLEGFSRITILLREPFTILGLLAVAFYRDWKLTVISLLIVPPIVFIISQVGKKLRRMTHVRQDQWTQLNSTLHETLSGIRIVKAFNLESWLERRFQEDNTRLLGIQFKWLKIENLMPVLLIVLGGFGLAFLSMYSGTSEVISVGIALGLLLDPLKKINGLYTGFQKALGGADRIFALLDEKPSVLNSPNAFSLKPFTKEIVFDRVFFKYKNQEDWTLENINLRVQKGDVIAFVGSSGVGKTTLVNFLPRFYDVVKGSIFIDSVDIRQVTLMSLRNQIAIVSQDVFLFNETIAQNISYGDITMSREDIVLAAQAANAHEFIVEFPNGYETKVGERGVKLSGGERQRISIARALLKNAPILILDEATSSLDTESEVLVQKAIEKLMKGRTSFIIAHRLSTIQHATRIIVLAQGRIVEEGTHDVLIEKRGLYYKFYQLQFSKQLGHVRRGEMQPWA